MFSYYKQSAKKKKSWNLKIVERKVGFRLFSIYIRSVIKASDAFIIKVSSFCCVEDSKYSDEYFWCMCRDRVMLHTKAIKACEFNAFTTISFLERQIKDFRKSLSVGKCNINVYWLRHRSLIDSRRISVNWQLIFTPGRTRPVKIVARTANAIPVQTDVPSFSMFGCYSELLVD